jgi:VanZ family protein
MNLPSVRQNPAKAVLHFFRFRYWLPVFVWMAIIFFASSDTQSYSHSSRFIEPLLHWLSPSLSPSAIESVHHAFRKCCHFTEYGILACLIWRAFRKQRKNNPRARLCVEAGLTLAIVLAYAAGDELHQAFIPTRSAQVSDVLVDTAGGSAALLALLWRDRFFKSGIRLERMG